MVHFYILCIFSVVLNLQIFYKCVKIDHAVIIVIHGLDASLYVALFFIFKIFWNVRIPPVSLPFKYSQKVMYSGFIEI